MVLAYAALVMKAGIVNPATIAYFDTSTNPPAEDLHS